MDFGLQDRVAMVAAASKGIGRAIAEALVSEGCRVSISARGKDSLLAARDALRAKSAGREILACPADVRKAEEIERWHSETVSVLGTVDILVTNTGGPPAARFLELSEDQWNEGLQLTLFNVIRASKLVIPGMKEKKRGRILHLTSFVAKQPVDLLTVSSTLRAGISALTKTMANQLAGDGILVNALLPGYVRTDRQIELGAIRSREEGISFEEYEERSSRTIPLRRSADPSEIGAVAAFLCSDRASYVTGVSLAVDGGLLQGTF
ncbi:MAG: SDR family oxidoreductase [Thermoanaerobaculia bacterium]